MATQSTLYSPFNGRLARSIGYEVEHGKQFSERGLMIAFDVRRTPLNSVRPVLPSSNFLSSFVFSAPSQYPRPDWRPKRLHSKQKCLIKQRKMTCKTKGAVMINFKHTLMLRLLIRTIWFQQQFSLDGKRRVISEVGRKSL